MITRSTLEIQPLSWADELRQAFTKPKDLLDALGLDKNHVAYIDDDLDFAFKVPRPFARRMRYGDPCDPLLAQVLPLAAETTKVRGFITDPVGELDQRRLQGLLQKYHGRALLIAAGACAVNCRYCFRRHYPYAEDVGSQRLNRAIDEIGSDPTISELILSGGDPLLLKDDYLDSLITRVESIGHLRRLRIHTRLPVMIPARFTQTLLERLSRSRLSTVVVVHINHPNEIDNELASALRECQRAGVSVLNQSVLLRDINDDAKTLAALSEALFEAAVLPYYIHLLDPVAGAAHFNVEDDIARLIASELRNRLPGYLVPKFVREISGELAKTPIA